MKLLGKIIIKGSLVTQTGLHLGGSKSSLNIGSIDNNVIKTALGKPYIPGSSIKGKLRSLLARVEGSLFFDNKSKKDELKRVDELLEKKKEDKKLKLYREIVNNATTDESNPSKYIMDLFGYSGDSNDTERVGHTRLLVRDSFLQNADAAIFNNGYTDSKWENVIDRKTGTAEHPRQLERVPVGASFSLELVYNIYDDANDPYDNEKENIKNLDVHLERLLLALQLLEDDGIGGSISRGYGQVKVAINDVVYKLIDEETMKYESLTPVNQAHQKLISDFESNFPQIS